MEAIRALSIVFQCITNFALTFCLIGSAGNGIISPMQTMGLTILLILSWISFGVQTHCNLEKSLINAYN